MRDFNRYPKQLFQVLLLVLVMEGQKVQVTGTDLTITVRSVKDFTSEGCLGGPVGCRDHVQLEVTNGKVSQQVILYVAQTEIQKEQRVNRTNVSGHEITLVTLQKKQVVLNITN
jgi:hypothetical protein